MATIAFPTVLHCVDHEGVDDLNRDLARVILRMEREQTSFANAVSVRGGFHSAYDFLEQDAEPIVRLKALIGQDVHEYLGSYWTHNSSLPIEQFLNGPSKLSMNMWGWAVVLRKHDSVAPHVHPSSHLSGVWYVTAPAPHRRDPPTAGHLMLTDPRAGATMSPIPGQPSAMDFEPRAGRSVLFPSTIEHYVLPFRADGERISVSYNLSL